MANEPINVAMYRYHIQQYAKREKAERIVEVGVFCADLSRLLASSKFVKSLTLVDPWFGGFQKRTQEMMDNIAKSVEYWAKTEPKVHVIRDTSVNAAARFVDNTIDFWHLDGDHSYDAVIADLNAWHRRVKPGKLMTGDNFEIPDVARATKEFFGKKLQVEGKGRIWLARK